MLYHSLFESRMGYGLCVWGGAPKTLLQPLVVTQKSIIRTILRKGRRHPSFPLFADTQILPVRHLYIYKTLPAFFQRSGQRPQPQAGRVTRQRPQYPTIRAHKDIFCKSWLYIAPKVANGLPNEVLEVAGMACFKNKLKEWLLSLTHTDLESKISPIYS